VGHHELYEFDNAIGLKNSQAASKVGLRTVTVPHGLDGTILRVLYPYRLSFSQPPRWIVDGTDGPCPMTIIVSVMEMEDSDEDHTRAHRTEMGCGCNAFPMYHYYTCNVNEGIRG
jgi:hypothetical protein